MKKIVSLIICINMIFSTLYVTSANDDIVLEEPKISFDNSKGVVSVSGVASSDSNIGICVLEPCNSWENAAKVGFEIDYELIRYFYQTSSSSDGSYSFSWKLGKKGIYPYRVTDGTTGNTFDGFLEIPYDDVSFTDLKFFDSQNNRIESLVSGKVVSGLTVDINYGLTKDVVMISALYSGDKLEEIICDKATNVSGKSNYFTTEITVPNDGKEYTLFTYIWDNLEAIKPLNGKSCISTTGTSTDIEDTLTAKGRFDFEGVLKFNKNGSYYYLSDKDTNFHIPASNETEAIGTIVKMEKQTYLCIPSNARVVTSGVGDVALKYSFKVMKENSSDALISYFRTSAYSQGDSNGSSSDIQLLNFDNDGFVKLGDKNVCSYVPGKWYDIVICINSSRNAVKVEITDESGSKTSKNVTYDLPYINKSSEFSAFVVSADNKTSYIDNFAVDYANDFSEKQHPYIMMTSQRSDEIRSQLFSDTTLRMYVNKVINDAKPYLNQGVSGYDISGGDLLTVSRRVLLRTRLLSFAYQTTKEEKYAQRAYKELEAAASFPDWNPSHFLDTAELMAAFAIGYDWIYDWMNEEQRAYLRSAIIEKGLTPALQSYESPNGGIGSRTNNWNFICNGGAAMAAMAVYADCNAEQRALCKSILEYSYDSITTLGFTQYYPDGAWDEGPTYWNYASIYAVYYLASLESFTGTIQGVEINDIKNPAYYIIALRGNKGIFNYGDSSEGDVNPYVLNYMANVYDDRAVSSYRKAYLEMHPSSIEPEDALWYRADMCDNYSLYDLPIAEDNYFRGSEVVTMRSSWREDSVFVAIRGGDKSRPHTHLDTGSFIAEFGGERFFSDLGPDSYSLNYSDLYRYRAEGHNTLVIDPDSDSDQNTSSNCKITKFESSDSSSVAVINMTEAYNSNAKSVKRGIKLNKQTGEFIIKDEIELSTINQIFGKTIYWFAHTKADIEISSDGQSAVLSLNGKRLLVKLLSSGMSFSIMDAKPLSTSPVVAGQAENTGYSKLVIKKTSFRKGDICVGMKLLSDGETDYVFGTQTSLDNWSAK